MIYPAPAAAALAGAGAPLALLVAVFAPGFWLAGLIWIFIVALLVIADAILGADRRAMTFELKSDIRAFIGWPADIEADVTFAKRTRPPRAVDFQFETNEFLRPRFRSYHSKTAGGRAHVTAELDTVRRGMGAIQRVWIEWRGPFGLVVKRRVMKTDRQVEIIPDIRSVKKEAIRIFARDTSIGQKIHIEKGGGSEFEALRDFLPGMDRRTIDWKQSARHVKLLSKEFRTEQDQTIIFAIDTGRLMCEPLSGGEGATPRIDHAINAALLLGYVSLKMGDRVGLFGFDAKPNVSTAAVSGVAAFTLLQRMAARLDYSTEETNFTLGLTQLSAETQRRSLIIIFTDFADPTSAELMIENVGRLMRTHLVLFVAMRDQELESLALAEPKRTLDVTRSVIAHSLIQEKELVLSRLQRLGAEIINAPAARIGPALLNRYLELKRQSRI
jgi:uncharacterized protein (DUF58 family)